MTYRFCHRCQAELPPHDEGTLIFCTHCGAPQVFLSEELQTQMEMQSQGTDGEAIPMTRDPRSLVWAGALRCVGLAAAVAVVLSGVAAAVPSVGFLSLFWAVISPVIVIGLFQSRFPLSPITTSFGARLGLLTGLAIGVVISMTNAVELLIRRFGTHGRGMTDFDKLWSGLFVQAQVAAAAQPGPGSATFAHMLDIPEFRAGMILASMAFGILILLAITTTGGAFAGFVRSRTRA